MYVFSGGVVSFQLSFLRWVSVGLEEPLCHPSSVSVQQQCGNSTRMSAVQHVQLHFTSQTNTNAFLYSLSSQRLIKRGLSPAFYLLVFKFLSIYILLDGFIYFINDKNPDNHFPPKKPIQISYITTYLYYFHCPPLTYHTFLAED